MSTLADKLGTMIRGLDGVEEGPTRFGSRRNTAWSVGRREFAHLHGDTVIDIRLPRNEQHRMRDDPRAIVRASASPWMEFQIETKVDVAAAFELVRLAWIDAGGGPDNATGG